MKTNSISWLAGIAFAAGLMFTRVAVADGAYRDLAARATSTNAADARAAIQALRDAGPAGLQALSDAYAKQIADHLTARAAAPDETWQRIRAAFDGVGRQRDNDVAQLYWFTDLKSATAAARAAGKPILSLRLLGKLDEEYSCANSRFFRTTLYPNAEVSRYLREHFILHWQSERPVPRITIDMGDGRRIERTITGNSIHYVLDSEGRPVDALPGLYGPKAFLRELARAVDAAKQMATLSGSERDRFLRDYHADRLRDTRSEWADDLKRANLTLSPGGLPFTEARRAMVLTASKSGVEKPLLNGVQGAGELDDSTWKAIATLHNEDAQFDASTVALIRRKQPDADDVQRLTFSKALVETPMTRMLRTLQRSTAEDSVRNEYQLHSRIHEWFANGAAPRELNLLNAKVYAELFLTPASDPWLGLVPADAFPALDHGGLVQCNPQP